MTPRTTLAAALLAITAVALAMSAAIGAASAVSSIVVALAYGALAVGVVRGAAWARWTSFGVALSGTLFALIGGGVPLTGWLVLALHAPLPLLLARPDEAHPRTAVSLLLAGAAMVPVLSLASGAAGALALGAGDVPRWSLAIGGVLAALGTVALARERTWGLLTVGLAGAALAVAYLASGPRGCGCASASSLPRELVAIGAVALLAAALPFAGPVLRFLRRG